MTYDEFWRPLSAVCGAAEAKAVAQMVVEKLLGMTLADALCGLPDPHSDTLLRDVQRRLLTGEPVQYVLGEAEFGPRTFAVDRSVLIPRPETFELCQWIAASAHRSSPRILDIGTGSGCIACTLAADIAGAVVTAWDISAEALDVARVNARRTGVNVAFEQADALSPPPLHPSQPPFDIIVSNPPYVCEHERAGMLPVVVDHEPALALFVPDDDPLRFYRATATYAAGGALARGGLLCFEINPLHADDLARLLSDSGLHDITTRRDQFGKKRFISCKRPHQT